MALQPPEIAEENVLHVRRIIYNGKVEPLKKVISKLVGHSSEAFTSQVYDHAEQREIGNALAVMGRRLAPTFAPKGLTQ